MKKTGDFVSGRLFLSRVLGLFLMLTCLFVACDPDENELRVNPVNFDLEVPESMNLGLIEEMEYFINSGKYGQVHSILVIKDGTCVFERYYNEADVDMLNPMYTATAFVTSALTGVAMDEGLINNQDIPLLDFFPHTTDLADRTQKQKIHLHHLLSQSAGLNSGMAWRDQEDAYDLILNSDMKSSPGTQFQNDAGASFLLGEIMRKATGISADSFAFSRLFTPLEISTWQWDKDPFGKIYTDGFSKGLWLTTRDFAKVGLLYLNNGTWEGHQIISDYWVNESVKPWMYMSYNYHQGYFCRVMNPGTTTPRLYNTSIINVNGLSQNMWIMKEMKTLVVVTADKNAPKDKLPEFLSHYLLPALFPGKTIEPNPNYSYQAQLLDSIRIDGDLSEWGDFEILVPENPARVRNSIPLNDYKPEIKVAWSRFRPTKIFIGAEIMDDVCIENQAINDHLTISLDLLNTGRSFQWVFDANGTFYGDVANEKNTLFEVQKLADRYYFEIEIDVWEGNPIEYDLRNFFIEPGTYMGLKINATDVDDFADFGTVMGWSTDDEQGFLFNDYTRPALYGSVFFTTK